MYRRFTTETQCALFAASVFIVFFTSTVVSVARAETPEMSNGTPPQIGWEDDSGNEIGSTDPYRPDYDGITGKDTSHIPSYGGAPRTNGPSIPGAPNTAGPNDNPPVFPIGWWQDIGSFFSSILEALGF